MDDGLILGGYTLCCVFTVIILCLILKPDLNNYYKQGQIDYANGIIKYELREQDNNEYIWVEKED